MVVSELLEAGKIVGSILGVWFALIGWKLVPACQGRPGEATTPQEPAR